MIRTVTAPHTKPKALPGKRNEVRIIGGGWRGRRVHFPDSPGLRPTPDRVRETLFNWLQQSIAHTRCLDLFAGSGALGLEALSRGAREVVFVEHAAVAAASLRGELVRLGGGANAQVVQTAAARFLSAPGAPFDVVFLDPPFGQGTLAEYVTLLDERRMGEQRRLRVSGERADGGGAGRPEPLGIDQIEVGGRGGVSSGPRQRSGGE